MTAERHGEATGFESAHEPFGGLPHTGWSAEQESVTLRQRNRRRACWLAASVGVWLALRAWFPAATLWAKYAALVYGAGVLGALSILL